MIAVGALVLGLAGSASADKFSPYPGTGVQTYYNQFADTCWIAIGPVYDSRATSAGFAVIGGVTVQNCTYKHTFKATVSEAYGYSRSGPFYTVPNASRSTTLAGVYGFGTCGSTCPSGRILETARICGGGELYYYTYATIDEYSATTGAFQRRVTKSSAVPASTVQAKPFNADGTC